MESLTYFILGIALVVIATPILVILYFHQKTSKEQSPWNSLANVGTFLQGAAAITLVFIGVIKTDAIMERIGELKNGLMEVKSLSVQMSSVLNAMRDDLKKSAIKKSGIEKTLEKSNLSANDIEKEILKIPSSWREAVAKSAKFFIPKESRHDLSEDLLSTEPRYRSTILETKVIPVEKQLFARFVTGPQGVMGTQDYYGLIGKSSSENSKGVFYLAEMFANPLVKCTCKTLKGEKAYKCLYNTKNSYMTIEGLQNSGEFEIICE